MVSVSAEFQPLYRPRYLPIVGPYVDHHLADILVDTSVDTSNDISVDTWLICRPKHWSSVGRYVNRYIGRGVHKIHVLRQNFWKKQKTKHSPTLFFFLIILLGTILSKFNWKKLKSVWNKLKRCATCSFTHWNFCFETERKIYLRVFVRSNYKTIQNVWKFIMTPWPIKWRIILL